MERTLILIKPDAVKRGIIGEIITRFEKVGLKIVGVKMLWPDRKHYLYHYETIGKMISRRGKKVFDEAVDFMQDGPVLAVVLEGVETAALVRKMVGSTESKMAQPGTIRGDYSHVSFEHANKQNKGIYNIIHASGDALEAKLEIAHWFKKDELFSYETAHEKYSQMKFNKKKK